MKSPLIYIIFLSFTACMEHANERQRVQNFVNLAPSSLSDSRRNTAYQYAHGEGSIKKDCSDSYSSADDAYTYSKRAYNSEDYEEVKYNLKKAINSFEDAVSNAEDCKCDDAFSSANEGYTYAKRGYNSEDFEDMIEYARKAKNAADDTMSNAEDCTNK